VRKVIRLTESDLEQIIKRVLKEQSVIGAPNQGMTINSNTLNEKKAIKKYYCVPPSFAPSIDDLIKKGYNKQILKVALSVVGRESSFASGLRYNITNSLKIVGGLLGYNTSSGPAQMSQETAKDLKLKQGIDTISGALNAVYQYLKRSYGIASSMGYSDTAKSVNVLPSNSFGAKTDIAIASYNMGVGRIVKYCRRGDSELNIKCDNKHKQIVKNYLPNIITNRWDNVEISTHGYVAEVVKNIKKFNCF
jgi:hypothetical protein